MPIPESPKVQPVIPDGYVFVAVKLADPALPVAIMGWPTKRRDEPGGQVYLWPVTQANVELRCQQENLDMVSWKVVRYNDIPDDRLYRDSLELVGGGVLAHNIEKAREIHRQHIRVRRAVKMPELDVVYQRADEAGKPADKKRIATQKQKLRDMPADPAIEAAQTIEQLKAFWPEDLT